MHEMRNRIGVRDRGKESDRYWIQGSEGKVKQTEEIKAVSTRLCKKSECVSSVAVISFTQ